MADTWSDLMTFLQAPYQRRLDAGKVVTPGPVDWGGVQKDAYDAFQAPYLARQERLSPPVVSPQAQKAVDAIVTLGGGRVTGSKDTSIYRYAPTDQKTNRYTPVSDVDPMWANRNLQGIAPPTQAQLQAMRDVTKIPSSYFTPRVSVASGTTRLPTSPDGWDPKSGYGPMPNTPSAVAATAEAAPSLPKGMQMFSGSRDSVANRTAGRIAATGMGGPRSVETPIQLQFEPGDSSGQRFADSEGRPFRTPSGKVYTPRGGTGAAPVLAGSPKDIRGAPQARQGGGLFSGGGILSSLFGGGSGGGAKLVAGMVPGISAAQSAAPAPSYATTPFQEDRFQTTSGAQMPASMNNSRWQTGY